MLASKRMKFNNIKMNVSKVSKRVDPLEMLFAN